MHHISEQIKKQWPYLAMLIIASLLIYFKHDYLFRRFIFLVGLLFVPFVARRNSNEKSIRYGLLSLLAASVLIFENGNMAYYFCGGFALLFLWEYKKGKLNNLPFFLLVIISPVFQYISEIWSFPIRLALSKWAGKLLSFMGKAVEVVGNVVVMDGNEFAVDPACMGLNMLSVSLLLSLVLMARQERLKQYTFSFMEIVAWMFMVLMLSVFSNFNRLLSLVLFRVLPENPMHDVWGLASLFVFVLTPIFYLLNWRSKYFEMKSDITMSYAKNGIFKRANRLFIPHLISMAIILTLVFNSDSINAELAANLKYVDHIALPGFTKMTTSDGMLKLEKDSVLLYIKPPAGFLRASHDPRICWRGSGFEFKQIKKETLNDIEVYTARMEKSDNHLYTAWWYDNGQTKTVEEWTWRWEEVLNGGQGFYLVNVTCATKGELENTIKDIFNLLLL